MRSFAEIDQRRRAADLTQAAVVTEAGVHKETWRRLANGTSDGAVRTLQKLDAAVDRLIERARQ